METSGKWGPSAPEPVPAAPNGHSAQWWAWVIIAIVVLAFFAWQAGQGQQDPAPPPPVIKSEPDVLEYHVTGTAKMASVTYKTGTGTQQNTVDVPMTNKGGGVGVIMEGSNIPGFKYISAQNKESYGSITCKIVLNGVTVSENTSSGGYVIATCQA